jgi:flavocytochrome c
MNKLKSLVALGSALCVLMLFAASGLAGTEAKVLYKEGTYTAEGDGINGKVRVEVTVSKDAIKSIKVLENKETVGLGDVALEKIPKEIMDKQSLAVDTVAGASYSSRAVLAAVEACLVKAGANIAALKKAAVQPKAVTATAKDVTTDVVVVGGGGSGMTAAIHVMYGGKKVILLEKMPMLGGNTVMGTTYVYGNKSATMKKQGKGTSDEEYFKHLMEDPTRYPEAVKVIVAKSGEAIDWLASLGAKLPRIINTYGHSPADGSAPGPKVVAALKGEMDRLGLDYRLSSKATDIVLNEGKISGVKVAGPNGNYTIHAKAVILCAGGFAANKMMLGKYDQRWADIGCSSSPGQNGDGILMGQAVGADVVDMDNIKVNPTVYYLGDTHISMSPLRHNGAIMVNKEGKRFANERGSYTGSSDAIMKQTGKKAYMIFDKAMLDIKLLNDYNAKGYFVSAPTLDQLADKLGINKENLKKTVETYKGYIKAKKDQEFGNNNFSITFEKPDYYGLEVSPAAQGTFGGLKVNTSTQVIDTKGKIIPGLYSVGENAGEGLQDTACQTVNLVFGKIAAETAIENLN